MNGFQTLPMGSFSLRRGALFIKKGMIVHLGAKRKLLVVAGAGSSIDFGMPSVNGVAGFLSEETHERYPLFSDDSTNLYTYFETAVAADWKAKVPPHLQRTPTFEEILYAVFALATAFPAGRFTSALGAFVTPKPLPDVKWMGGSERKRVGPDTLRDFGHFLVDKLLNTFRDRCRVLGSQKKAELTKLQALFTVLIKEFEISIVTLNYDDVAYRSAPGLETGFDCDGKFVDERIVQRPAWPCILHLHGSVHFDMRDDYTSFTYGGLHEIHWQENLAGQFHQNAEGRSSFATVEGTDFPTSSIVAGYGKTTQILRRPFRTYFAEVDRLVTGCDAALFLGYGFSDIHLNLAFEKFRDARRRPVVVIDLADDNAMTASGIEMSDGHLTVSSVLGLFKTQKHSMTWLGHTAPAAVAGLKAAQEFEISNDPDFPLAIWYGGMLAACNNIDKVLARLRG